MTLAEALVGGPRGRGVLAGVAWPAAQQWPDTPEELAALIDAQPLPVINELMLREVLQNEVDNEARYWQPPEDDQLLLGHPAVRRALLRIAEHVLASPAAAWWSTGCDRTRQWMLTWKEELLGCQELVDLEQWRLQKIEDEARYLAEGPISGDWWSSPPWGVMITTRELPDGTIAGMHGMEDSFGWEKVWAQRVDVKPAARIYEVGSADDWARLCRRFPLEVSAQKHADWLATTGREGRWVMPDYSAVAQHFDGVHVSVAGYLATAGVAVDVTDDTASVLAGWNPDETYWFEPAVTLDVDKRAFLWELAGGRWRRA